MTLCETLQKATSEEDVKTAYIKALGLKNVQRNLIDIQTKEICFEAKVGLIVRTDPDHPNSPRQKYALNGVRQTTLAYDSCGRISSMQVPTTEKGENVHSPIPTQNSNSFQWTYLQGSDLKQSLSYPNGLTASWSYDANNQLLQVRNATPTNGISQFDYAYDAAGRRTTIAKSGTAFEFDDVVSYGYNERSELTNAVAAVDANYRYSYQYDPIGNRESSFECGTNTTYAANELNQYTQIVAANEDVFVPEFDDDGNQTLVKTATGIWSVIYNGENRPILWTCGTTNIVMSYDRMGRRVTKNDQWFVYDGYLQIANFHSATTTSGYNYFTWDPTEPVATRPVQWNQNGVVAYYTHDGNKNVREVVNADGSFTAHYEHALFGGLSLALGGRALSNPWRFSCEYTDDEICVNYYNHRHLNGLEGRWISRDPSFELGGFNLYGFCRNNSLIAVDFRGENPVFILFILGILTYPQIANAPADSMDAKLATSSPGATAVLVDYAAGKVLTMGVKCCGMLLGTLKFRYWENVAIKNVKEVASKSRVGAVGAAFDPVEGRVAVEISGKFNEKPTRVMAELAEELGGLGNAAQCKNPIGACVEFKGADTLLRQHSVMENIRFTSAIRPRTGKILSPCAHCLKMLEKFEKGPVDYWQNFNLYWLPLFWLNDTEEDL